MQKKTIYGQKCLVSVITMALLSACGGSGDNKFVNADEIGSFTGPAHKPLDPVKGSVAPVTTLLVNGSELSKIGQQNSPAVAIVDADNSLTYNDRDQVRYEQVALLSSVCLFGECGPSANALKKKVEREKKGIEEQLKQLAELEKAASQTAANNSGKGDGGNGNQEQPQGLSPAQQQAKQALEARKAWLEQVLPEDDLYASVDVNGDINTYGLLTIDDSNTGIKREINDAGVSKIDKERVNGQLVEAGGTVLRRFNGIMPLYNISKLIYTGKDEKRLAYLRSPSVSGWSYQTFLRYYSTKDNNVLQRNRDLLQGYQSVGHPTDDMPDRNWADYNGISHALYNGHQVTMENRIHADFASRSLDYKTVGTPILHTFEKGEHIIERRPDMGVSGSANWQKGSATFNGHVRTANGLQGRLEGRFYGPAAAEIGGVFGMQGQVDGTVVDYIGGFGGKRL